MSDTRKHFKKHEAKSSKMKARMIDACIQIAKEYGVILSANTSVSVDYDAPSVVVCDLGISLQVELLIED